MGMLVVFGSRKTTKDPGVRDNAQPNCEQKRMELSQTGGVA